MPPVALESTSQALSAPRPYAARMPQATDGAAPTPFENLLDDTASAPQELPPQPAPADRSARATRSEPARQPAKSTDNKPADTGDQASAAEPNPKPEDSVKADANGDLKTDGKAKSATDLDTDSSASETNATDQANQTNAPVAGIALVPTKIVDPTPVAGGNSVTGIDSGAITTAAPTTALPPVDPTQATQAITSATVTQPSIVSDLTSTLNASSPVPTVSSPAPTVSIPAPTSGPASVLLVANAKKFATVTPAAPDAPDTPTAPTATPVDAGKGEQVLASKLDAPVHDEAKPQASASGTDDKATTQARSELAAPDHHSLAPQPADALVTLDANALAPKADAPPPALIAQLQTGAPANPGPAAPPIALVPQAAAIPLAGVPLAIASKAASGNNHFEIRLDPPELGRIEVRLNVDRDGNVSSRMIVDRADTLDLLRRDATGLERALQDAGLKTADNSLQFSLRDQSAYQQQQQQAQANPAAAQLVVEDEMLTTVDVPQPNYSRLAGLGSGLDIHV